MHLAGHTDALSRPEDTLKKCDCYKAGMSVENLPFGGCAYCRRPHRQWARFNDDVDDVVPLGVRIVLISGADQSVSGNQTVSNWEESLVCHPSNLRKTLKN